ncbi:YihY/virulence factor BrkB family protein [Flagellimonas amoyensis]|uniref:YihY/virulence factor BrkB family protein n=1 Tax=Flagellimonas amoyensis TaxID=2169401 RepID=UPI000D347FBD|nr:YihY/virulence factor BrkB family protein [Allomuricauda amoyensis]
MGKPHTYSEQFRYRDFPYLILDTYKAWGKVQPWRLSAVVAYYAVLSLPALLVIIINLVGAIWGVDIVQGRLTDEFTIALGSNAAETIEKIVQDTQNKDQSLISTVIGIATLLFGATGVLYQLKISLNEIWRIDRPTNFSFWKLASERARSFAFILVIGFLLLISFMVTAAISALNDYLRSIITDAVIYLAYAVDIVSSIAIITVMFALMFKFLPDARIKWRAVWFGAFITAVMFVIGKFLLGLYFGMVKPDSTYGAAGTIVLILLWVSYSCLILFFGAQFTYVYAKTYNILFVPYHRIRKRKTA